MIDRQDGSEIGGKTQQLLIQLLKQLGLFSIQPHDIKRLAAETPYMKHLADVQGPRRLVQYFFHTSTLIEPLYVKIMLLFSREKNINLLATNLVGIPIKRR
jgi:hypothetical protein